MNKLLNAVVVVASVWVSTSNVVFACNGKMQITCNLPQDKAIIIEKGVGFATLNLSGYWRDKKAFNVTCKSKTKLKVNFKNLHLQQHFFVMKRKYVDTRFLNPKGCASVEYHGELIMNINKTIITY